MYFNPEIERYYRACRMNQTTYYCDILRNIDIVLKEDQLPSTRSGMPLVLVPNYIPTQYEMEQDDIHCIIQYLNKHTNRAASEMQIMPENTCKAMLTLMTLLFPGSEILTTSLTWISVLTMSAPF